jgi:signal transduction histidine kinase
MFQGLRSRLLVAQLTVMAAILGIFGTGVYVFFSRSLYQQLDKKLLTLAQSATPVLANIKTSGDGYLDSVNEVPWRDIFNRDRQSLEWFDATGQIIANRGTLDLVLSPQVGSRTLLQSSEMSPVRAYTVSVFRDNPDSGEPILEGYVRASQSVEDIETVQRQLLWGLGMGGAIALVGVGVGGLWLTRKSVEPIETSFEQLKRFTADASHELRSPLTAIKTSVDVIRNHPERIHPKDAKKLDAIASATNQMSQLAEDLLFLTRADASKWPESAQQPVSLNELLFELAELFEPSAHAKAVTLACQGSRPVSVLGDRIQLHRLFANLIQNAIQYTPEDGKINILISQANRYAVVRIDDTGIGIEPEQLTFVFNRFWRADRARSRRQGGTGLGLAIAQAIAQRHGGKITVHSELGKGSCFQVRLPVLSSH